MMRRLHAPTVVSYLTVMLVAIFSTAQYSAAQWLTPGTPEPGGNIAPLLNVSAAAQTKAGGLIIKENTVIASPNRLTVGRLNGTSRICWNDDGTGSECKDSWDDIPKILGYLHLQPPVPLPGDAGFAVIQGGIEAPIDFPSAIRGIAGTPSSTIPTYGIYGQATASSLALTGAGVAGQPGGVSGNAQYTIVGDTGGRTSAFAAYFKGDVAVGPIGGASSRDLIISNAPPAFIPPNPNPAEARLCFGTAAPDCRSVWQTGVGTGLWNDAANIYSPKDLTRSLSIARSGFGPGLQVTYKSATDADLSVPGAVQFDAYVVGTPTANIPFSATCGDDLCTFPENDTFGSVLYCPKDCDITPPGNVRNLRVVSIVICTVPPRITFAWDWSVDLDYAGVKIKRTSGSPPTGPTIPTTNIAYDSPECDQATRNCTVTHRMATVSQNYFGFYTYDFVPQYSPGIVLGPYNGSCS